MTGIPPYDATMACKMRTKLDYRQREETNDKENHSKINERDKEYKVKIKASTENKNTEPHRFSIGDYVLC